MAFAGTRVGNQDDSTDSQGSDISGLSTFDMETTDTFDRRMAQQVRKQQLLRKAAGGQALFGRQSSNASLRSAMGSLERQHGGTGGTEAKEVVHFKSSRVKILPDDTARKQWGFRSNNNADTLRRTFSGNTGAAVAHTEPAATTSSSAPLKSDFTYQGPRAKGDTHPGQLDRDQRVGQVLGNSSEDLLDVGQDSPMSLRSERRGHLDHRKAGDKNQRPRLGLANFTSSRPQRMSRPGALPLSYDHVDIATTATMTELDSGLKLSARDPKFLLKRLAQAASLSPASRTQDIEESNEAGDRAGTQTPPQELSMPTDMKMEDAAGKSFAPSTSPSWQQIPTANVAQVRTSSLSAPVTPKVTGSWVDTPDTKHGHGVANGLLAKDFMKHKLQRKSAAAILEQTTQHSGSSGMSKMASLSKQTYMQTAGGLVRLRWGGMLVLVATAWAISEIALWYSCQLDLSISILTIYFCSQYYCQPRFAYSMDGYGVNVTALHTPFVTTSILFKPLELLWRPLLGILYWLVHWLTQLSGRLGAAEAPTPNDNTRTDPPRQTIVYNLNEWSSGSISSDEIL